MAFKERTREFWINVAGNKCQYEFYTEKKGWQQCDNRVDQVHHIIGEGETLTAGEDPERNVGLALCKDHHSKNTGEVLGEYESSFHPDIGHAYGSYKEWKQQEEHMNSITGRRTIDYSTSPFADAQHDHHDKTIHGERYINGDDGTDNYYIDKMRSKAVLYEATTGEKKPNTTPHAKTDKSKKTHWYDDIFD